MMRPVGDGRFELDDHEIAIAMEIGKRLKLRLAMVVQTAIEAGQDSDTPEQCVLSAITTETLLIAACCHTGTAESFRQMVEFALLAAARFKADPDGKARIQ
jgi:hypothetical protein